VKISEWKHVVVGRSTSSPSLVPLSLLSLMLSPSLGPVSCSSWAMTRFQLTVWCWNVAVCKATLLMLRLLPLTERLTSNFVSLPCQEPTQLMRQRGVMEPCLRRGRSQSLKTSLQSLDSTSTRLPLLLLPLPSLTPLLLQNLRCCREAEWLDPSLQWLTGSDRSSPLASSSPSLLSPLLSSVLSLLSLSACHHTEAEADGSRYRSQHSLSEKNLLLRGSILRASEW
jgi:hypothetical protein